MLILNESAGEQIHMLIFFIFHDSKLLYLSNNVIINILSVFLTTGKYTCVARSAFYTKWPSPEQQYRIFRTSQVKLLAGLRPNNTRITFNATCPWYVLLRCTKCPLQLKFKNFVRLSQVKLIFFWGIKRHEYGSTVVCYFKSK